MKKELEEQTGYLVQAKVTYFIHLNTSFLNPYSKMLLNILYFEARTYINKKLCYAVVLLILV